MSTLPSESDICAFLDRVESALADIRQDMITITSMIKKNNTGWSMETKGLLMITSLHYREGV